MLVSKSTGYFTAKKHEGIELEILKRLVFAELANTGLQYCRSIGLKSDFADIKINLPMKGVARFVTMDKQLGLDPDHELGGRTVTSGARNWRFDSYYLPIYVSVNRIDHTRTQKKRLMRTH